jgi:fumarate hydratase class II
VMSEMLLMVCAQVIGHDATIAWGGAAGTFELNVMIPVMAASFLSAVSVLSNACHLFASRCVDGLVANEARATAFVEQSLAMATALNPRIGYDAAAAIAREAAATGKTVRQLCLEKRLMPPDELERLLDPRRMTGP